MNKYLLLIGFSLYTVGLFLSVFANQKIIGDGKICDFCNIPSQNTTECCTLYRCNLVNSRCVAHERNIDFIYYTYFITISMLINFNDYYYQYYLILLIWIILSLLILLEYVYSLSFIYGIYIVILILIWFPYTSNRRRGYQEIDAV